MTILINKYSADITVKRYEMAFRPCFVTLFVIAIFTISPSYADEIVPFLLGYNVSAPLISKYDTLKLNPADFGLSMSIYKIKSRKNGIRFDHGLTIGFEVNKFTGRGYLGNNWLLIGFMRDNFFYIPMLFGISTKALVEISKYDKYFVNVGGDIGVWLNLGILGQVGISERYMLGNNLSTRIEYGHRMVFFGERKSQEKH